MPFYALVFILIIISASTGLLSRAEPAIGARPFELAFICASVFAMSSFTIAPIQELEVNIATVMLPVILASAAKRSAALAAAAYFALAPLTALILSCAVELALTGYTAFNADCALLNAQTASALCALLFACAISKMPRVIE